MKVLLVAATTMELESVTSLLPEKYEKLNYFDYQYKTNIISTLVTGVGSTFTAFGIARTKDITSYDLVINVGIAGAYDYELKLGSTVEIVSDVFGDLGATDQKDEFMDLFEMGLGNKDRFPFKEGRIVSKHDWVHDFKRCAGLTVNNCTGTRYKADLLMNKYAVQIETMEAASVLYSCAMLDIECIILRSISNYVEDRDTSKWEINLALDNLGKSVVKLLEKNII